MHFKNVGDYKTEEHQNIIYIIDGDFNIYTQVIYLVFRMFGI